MEEKRRHNGFDSTAWFQHQVHSRTRAALDARGSQASTHSREYKTEYSQQCVLFRAERMEVKRRKHEKYLEREKKRKTAARIGVH